MTAGIRMNDIAALDGCILQPPGGMVQFSEAGLLIRFDWPLRMFIGPAALDLDGGFPIGINQHFDASFLDSFGEMTDEEFCPP